MADLIDRDKLLAAYDAAHKGPPGWVRKLIVEAPAVDAVPVRRGRWKAVKAGAESYPFWDCRCDVCKWTTSIAGAGSFDFCPHCGADMREGKKNG